MGIKVNPRVNSIFAQEAGGPHWIYPLIHPITSWRWGWVVASIALMPLDLSPSLFSALLGVIWWFRHLKQWVFDRLNQALVAFMIWLGLVTYLASNPEVSLPGIFNFLPFLGLFMVLSQALQTQQASLWIMKTWVAAGIFIAILGLLDALGIWILGLGPAERASSIFASPNTLAVYLVMTLALAGGLYLGHHNQRLCLIFWSLGVPLLGLTASRNGWGIACLGLILVLVIRRVWIGIAAVLSGVGLSIGAALNLPGFRWIVPASIWQRIVDTFDPQAQAFSSTANRWDAWQFAIQMIQQRPWQGWGWQSFSVLYNAQIPAPPEYLTHCHNLYLTLAAEGGVLTLLGFLGLWSWILWRGWQAWRVAPAVREPLLLGLNVALVCYFLSGFLDVVFFDGRINLLVWILLASVNGGWLQLKRVAL